MFRKRINYRSLEKLGLNTEKLRAELARIQIPMLERTRKRGKGGEGNFCSYVHWIGQNMFGVFWIFSLLV